MSRSERADWCGAHKPLGYPDPLFSLGSMGKRSGANRLLEETNGLLVGTETNNESQPSTSPVILNGTSPFAALRGALRV
jgi:hypothetical protein